MKTNRTFLNVLRDGKVVYRIYVGQRTKHNKNNDVAPAKLVSVVGKYDEPIYPKPVPAKTIADLMYHSPSNAALRPMAKALLKG